MTESAWWGEDIVPRIRWRIEIAEGECIPDGYGIAWRRYDRLTAVCMPVGLHVLVGTLRNAYWRLVHGGLLGPTKVERLVLAARMEERATATRRRFDAEDNAYTCGWNDCADALLARLPQSLGSR